MNGDILSTIDTIFSRRFILIMGEWGRGKTLSMSALLYYGIVFKKFRRIVSNIPFNFNDFGKAVKTVPLIETAQFDQDVDNTNTIFCGDEIHNSLGFDSRKFRDPRVEILSTFTTDLRKDESIFVGTIQYADWLEFRASTILQLIIIQNWINTYSKDEKEDRELRVQNKDFWSRWRIIDRKDNQELELVVNLYEFLGIYDTRFKPHKIICNHKDYCQNHKFSSNKARDIYFEQCNTDIVSARKNWLEDNRKLCSLKI